MLVFTGQEAPAHLPATALDEAPKREDRLPAFLEPAHPGPLHALCRQSLAGGLHHTATDGKVPVEELLVTQAVLPLPEVVDHPSDRLLLRAPGLLPSVAECPDHTFRAVLGLPQPDATLLKGGLGLGRRVAMVGIQRRLHLLQHMEDVDRFVLLPLAEPRRKLRQELPVVLESVGEAHEDQARPGSEDALQLGLQLALQRLLLRLRHTSEANRLKTLT